MLANKGEERTEDVVGGAPFVAPKMPRPRERRGIGDNSGETAGSPHENVSLETISGHVLIAQEKVAEYGGMLKSKAAEIETKGIETLSAIYVVSHGINEAGAYDRFLAKYGISVHGNTRNPWQPVVACCFLTFSDRKYAKSAISKMAVVVGHGIANNLSAEAFTELLRSAGIENLYNKYKSSHSKNALTEAQQEELVNAAFPDRPDAPVCSDPEVVQGSSGDIVAVVHADGAGKFYMRAIIEDRRPEVLRMLSTIARKRLAQ
jgi:hypothetical protein